MDIKHSAWVTPKISLYSSSSIIQYRSIPINKNFNIYWTAKETSQQITESQTFILKYNKHKVNLFYIVWMVDLLSLGYEIISNVSIKQNHNILML